MGTLSAGREFSGAPYSREDMGVSSRTFRFPDLFKQRLEPNAPRAGPTCRQTSTVSVYQKENSEISSADEPSFDSARRLLWVRQSDYLGDAQK
jgi:hypothetical protein